MSRNSENEQIDLNDIMKISEDEFKKQISTWINERGISRKLQSKLRADLFEQFNRTHLGRQMSEQHQLVHRIVLSPLILVLNTLVADFLHAEDCHFSLSVFANEVPYKNTMPNFEATPSKQMFRFTENELNDIFEAIGISKESEQHIREFYLNERAGGINEIMNKSLLYCIFRTMISGLNTGTNMRKNNFEKVKTKPSKSTTPLQTSSTQQSISSIASRDIPRKCSNCASRSKHDKFYVSSRYFKYLNRYLDILSDRLSEMSQSMHGKRSKHNQKSVDSSSQESSLRKDLRKMIDNINRLTKSRQKNKRYQDILNSIEKLSVSVDKCGQNMENLLQAATANVKSMNNIVTETNPTQSKKKAELDYGSWLKELKTSENGKKFIDRLEMSLQKTMEKEREHLEKLYEEKTKNYRMLIRLHYKQKYDSYRNEKTGQSEPNETNSIDKISPDDTERALADTLAVKAIEKEHQVDQIVQTAK